MERDFEIAFSQLVAEDVLFVVGRDGSVRRVGAAIPKHDGAATVLALRDRALEGVVVDGVIFDLHRESLHRWIKAGPFRHRPAFHYAIELESKIEMQVTGGVFLNDEAKASSASRFCGLLARRFFGATEITLAPILGELRARVRGTASRLYSHV